MVSRASLKGGGACRAPAWLKLSLLSAACLLLVLTGHILHEVITGPRGALKLTPLGDCTTGEEVGHWKLWR
jgi:hypothetical protein